MPPTKFRNRFRRKVEKPPPPPPKPARPARLLAEPIATGTEALIFRLPPELRLAIYTLVFQSELDEDILDRQACFPLPPLLRTCRILRLEARECWVAQLQVAIADIPARNDKTERICAETFIPPAPWWTEEVVLDEKQLRRARQAARDRNLKLLAKVRPRMLPKRGRWFVKKTQLWWWRKLAKWQEPE